MGKLVQITRYTRCDFNDLVNVLEERKKKELFAPQISLQKLSKYVADSVTSSSKLPVPDCQTCGACCDLDAGIEIDGEFASGFDTYWEIVSDGEPEVIIDRVLAWDVDSAHCCHLDGNVGEFVSCTAYEQRPTVCRTFEAGSDRCHEFRRMYGLEPQLGTETVLRDTPPIVEQKLNVITGIRISLHSVSVGVSPSDDDPEQLIFSKRITMRITVVVDHKLENEIELHKYNPAEEQWFERELIGMTLDEVQERIERKGNWIAEAC